MITHNAVAAAAMSMLPISLGVSFSFSLGITLLSCLCSQHIAGLMSFIARDQRICRMASKIVFSMRFTPSSNDETKEAHSLEIKEMSLFIHKNNISVQFSHFAEIRTAHIAKLIFSL